MSNAYRGTESASHELATGSFAIDAVDVIIKTNKFDQLDIPANHYFSECIDSAPASSSTTPDWDAYKAMIHESGHAIGLSGFGITDFGHYDWDVILTNIYESAHPTTSYSVMNYDTESDCFPNPIDVMAVYALYQTLSP